MQEAGYEIKPGKYISFRAEGQERFTRAKTIGENYTEERLKERIAGRNPRKQRMQTERKGIWALDSVPEQEPDEIPPCVMVGQQLEVIPANNCDLDWTEFAGLCWTIRTEGNIDRSQGYMKP